MRETVSRPAWRLGNPLHYYASKMFAIGPVIDCAVSCRYGCPRPSCSSSSPDAEGRLRSCGRSAVSKVEFLLMNYAFSKFSLRFRKPGLAA